MRRRAKRSAIGIDVDSLRFYHEIHGLPPRADDLADPIYTVALGRFFELLDRARVPATVFAIGADAPRHADAFAPLAATGSELASHSFAHDYRLIRRSAREIEDDLAEAHLELSRLSGRPVTGFRAPGYNTSPALLQAALRLGYRYDSSMLPSPPYFAARAAAIALYGARGHPSRSLAGEPRAFLGPLHPYRTHADQPWRPSPDGALVELPMTCEPLTRAPIIGTTWALAGDVGRRVMLESALGLLEVINFELHAIDLLDHTDAGIDPALAAAQRDLSVPVREKMRAFEALFARLRSETEVTTLDALARAWSSAS